MKTVKDKYVELCLRLDEADKTTNTRKYNQAARSLNNLSKYLDENREEAIFLVELLTHENDSVRGHAAASCYNRELNQIQAVAVIGEVYGNAPIGNLRAGMGIKLGIISGRIVLPDKK